MMSFSYFITEPQLANSSGFGVGTMDCVTVCLFDLVWNRSLLIDTDKTRYDVQVFPESVNVLRH